MAGSVHKYETKSGETKWMYMLDLGKDEKGRRKQKKKSGFKTEREAKKELRLAEAELIKGTYVEPSKMLYEKYLDDWFKTKRKSLGIQTIEVYESHLKNYIKPFLGSTPLLSLKTIHVDNFINHMHEKGYTPSTIKKSINIIKSSLEHAIDTELLSKNVAKKATLPKEKKKEMEVWSKQEVQTFLKVAKGDRLYALFYLALTTGMRQGELLGLRWKDIDLDNQLLRVNQVLAHNGKDIISEAKTEKSNRTVELGESTISVLKAHRKQLLQEKLLQGKGYQDNDLVFCTPLGTPLNSSNIRSRNFNGLIKQAGLKKIRFHDLRHTCATLLLSEGVNVKIISEMLGHSNIKITLDTYSHVLPTMQKEAVNKLENMINS
ncbi:site-specific integrase [Sutcliffiella sp. NC1]|uniref:site-specific integrase n=1 Tax=Sutcliffiella sp. NC1 TaxID=3004096 RepID=UPI0022DE89C1|nr:site-specific integrase [Sutcliffiella sp. NC1]WBL16339.1 site-specific integrase [Sutcliffiella sp. NC1]